MAPLSVTEEEYDFWASVSKFIEYQQVLVMIDICIFTIYLLKC